jgi:hypothetical protein
VIVLQYPPYKLIDVEGILENLSELEAICLIGLDVLPLRLIGTLQGVRSSEGHIAEDNPRIFRREGCWEFLADRKAVAD